MPQARRGFTGFAPDDQTDTAVAMVDTLIEPAAGDASPRRVDRSGINAQALQRDCAQPDQFGMSAVTASRGRMFLASPVRPVSTVHAEQDAAEGPILDQMTLSLGRLLQWQHTSDDGVDAARVQPVQQGHSGSPGSIGRGRRRHRRDVDHDVGAPSVGETCGAPGPTGSPAQSERVARVSRRTSAIVTLASSRRTASSASA